MEVDTGFLSDRLIFNDSLESKFQIANSFWDWVQRIIAWIWSPASYSDENRRTIACFQHYLIDTLGAERLQRISSRYDIDLAEMYTKGYPLLSRDVAKIVIGSKNISVEDISEKAQTNFLDLDAKAIEAVYRELSSQFDPLWQVAEITDRITGRPTEYLARLFYDPFLADRERQQIVKEHSNNTFIDFVHNMVARVIKRDMDVGMLVPAPNQQFYYVSAKIVTEEGMVSYILHPASKDSTLEPIRLFRGTAARNSELAAIPSVMTDLESNVGMSAHLSGNPFEKVIQERLGAPVVEAGHSMGATIVQHRLVDMDHIKTAYLFCGPGVTEEELERFNRKNPHVHLFIRVASNDPWHRLGEVHLGYRPPSNVNVDFVQFRPSYPHDHDPHVTIWPIMPQHFEPEAEISPEARDEALYHKNSLWERCRSLIGPVVAKILGWIRDFFHFLFSCRIASEAGLKIGQMQGQRWRVDHFRLV